MTRWTIGALLCALIGAGALSSGCNDSARATTEVATPVDPTRVWVESFLPNLNTELRRHAEAVATGKALKTYLAREARRSWNARVAGGIKYADLFEKLYDKRDYHKAFAQSDGMTTRGEAILEVLLDSERHALDSSPYHVARIQTLVANLERVTEGEPAWQGISLTADEANELVGWLKAHELDPADPDTRIKVLSALVGASTRGVGNKGVLASPAPRITGQMDQFLDAFEKSAELTAELELRVADGALRYARDMKHFNLARQDWRDLRDAGGSKALIYGRLEKTYKELGKASPTEVKAVMAALAPSHPQYEKLLDVLARYRAIAADGGWERVRPTSLDIGHRSKRVEALRRRLAAEGFLPSADEQHAAGDNGGRPDPAKPGATGARAARANDDAAAEPAAEAHADVETDATDSPQEPDPQVVDEQLVEAVKSYQETHQFRPDGDPTPGVWRSLNLPVSRRIEQIELAIQRWRESHYQGEKDFIMVNIPDFHAEVFRGGERAMRFRVVTGNKKRTCNEETGKWEYPNATPIQMAELDHVIVNPYWYVPQRIVREELEPKMSRDPDYLEKKNYEKVMMGGKETIRQKPGDDNALGRVKFIFPNPHNTYMHDTPQKKYFDYPVRAFSHGCMRVHKPFELARHLLENDPNGKEYDFDELLEKERQKYIELAAKMPVFVEYYTVRVDDQGRPHFLADIYRYDRARLVDDPEEAEKLADCRVRTRKRKAVEVEEGSDEQPEGVDEDLGP
ncbi:L,D-transpeptidase family protein [Persicimonas caeni]|nr:L,D-transpeptidase family protein [Persicimonas caeni]